MLLELLYTTLKLLLALTVLVILYEICRRRLCGYSGNHLGLVVAVEDPGDCPPVDYIIPWRASGITPTRAANFMIGERGPWASTVVLPPDSVIRVARGMVPSSLLVGKHQLSWSDVLNIVITPRQLSFEVATEISAMRLTSSFQSPAIDEEPTRGNFQASVIFRQTYDAAVTKFNDLVASAGHHMDYLSASRRPANRAHVNTSFVSGAFIDVDFEDSTAKPSETSQLQCNLTRLLSLSAMTSRCRNGLCAVVNVASVVAGMVGERPGDIYPQTISTMMLRFFLDWISATHVQAAYLMVSHPHRFIDVGQHRLAHCSIGPGRFVLNTVADDVTSEILRCIPVIERPQGRRVEVPIELRKILMRLEALVCPVLAKFDEAKLVVDASRSCVRKLMASPPITSCPPVIGGQDFPAMMLTLPVACSATIMDYKSVRTIVGLCDKHQEVGSVITAIFAQMSELTDLTQHLAVAIQDITHEQAAYTLTLAATLTLA